MRKHGSQNGGNLGFAWSASGRLRFPDATGTLARRTVGSRWAGTPLCPHKHRCRAGSVSDVVQGAASRAHWPRTDLNVSTMPPSYPWGICPSRTNVFLSLATAIAISATHHIHVSIARCTPQANGPHLHAVGDPWYSMGTSSCLCV